MRQLLIALLGVVCLAPAAWAGNYIHSERSIPGRYVVVFAPSAVRAPNAAATAPGRTVRQLMADMALSYDVVAKRPLENALQGAVIETTEGRARALARDPRVAWVEEDRKIEAFSTDLAVYAWWADRSDERDRPLNNHFTYSQNGAGVNIYIIDTGVNSSSGYWSGRFYNAYSTVVDGSGNMVFGDPVGHGTNVAIHAAATGWGIARGAKVRAVRVKTVTCGVSGGNPPDIPAYAGTCFPLTDLVQAIDWVAGHRITPAVANLSLGGGVSATLETAVTGMYNANVTVVAAAGNSSASACNVSPARMSQVITVGATTSGDAKASFSNYGSCVDLFAPGQDVYNGVDGTSFSAPMVAGAAAIRLQASPSSSPSAVKSYLLNNATTGRLSSIGSGSPNKLLYIPPGGTESDSPPTANFNYSCNGRTCTFTSTSTDDFGTVGCTWYWDHEYLWQPRTGCSLSHTFPRAGSYGVILTANDDVWQQSTKTKTVTVN